MLTDSGRWLWDVEMENNVPNIYQSRKLSKFLAVLIQTLIEPHDWRNQMIKDACS